MTIMAQTNVHVNPTTIHRQRLSEAARTGDIVTVRFVAGRTHHTRHAATGTVDGFIRRPREAEKVRLQQRPGDVVMWEVPVRDIEEVQLIAADGARIATIREVKIGGRL
jgi:hypothetical protein